MRRYFWLLLGWWCCVNAVIGAEESASAVWQCERDQDGAKRVSLICQQQDTWTLLSKLTQVTGYRLVADAPTMATLKATVVAVCLKQRLVTDALEFLTGAAGITFRLDGSTVTLLLQTDRQELWRAAIAGHKKYLLPGDDEAAADPIAQERKALAYFSLGTLLYAQQQHKLAVAEYELFGQNFPQHALAPYALLLVVQSLLADRQAERARTTLSQFFNLFPKHELGWQAFMLLATCYERQENREQAAKIYQYLLYQHALADKQQVQFRLAQLQTRAQQYVEAQTTWHVLVASLPNDSPLRPQAMTSAALCQFMLGQYWSAYCLARPLLESPDQAVRRQALTVAVQSATELGNFGLAAMFVEQELTLFLTQAPETDREALSLWYEIGRACQQSSQLAMARTIFEKLAGRYDDTVYLRLMECAYETGNYRDCLTLFRAALPQIKTPQVADAALHLAGQCWLKLGDPRQAEQIWLGK